MTSNDFRGGCLGLGRLPDQKSLSFIRLDRNNRMTWVIERMFV